MDFGLLERKLVTLVKTLFASNVVMIEQCLAYLTAIIMCYKPIGFHMDKPGQLPKQFVMHYLLLCLHVW